MERFSSPALNRSVSSSYYSSPSSSSSLPWSSSSPHLLVNEKKKPSTFNTLVVDDEEGTNNSEHYLIADHLIDTVASSSLPAQTDPDPAIIVNGKSINLDSLQFNLFELRNQQEFSLLYELEEELFQLSQDQADEDLSAKKKLNLNGDQDGPEESSRSNANNRYNNNTVFKLLKQQLPKSSAALDDSFNKLIKWTRQTESSQSSGKVLDRSEKLQDLKHSFVHSWNGIKSGVQNLSDKYNSSNLPKSFDQVSKSFWATFPVAEKLKAPRFRGGAGSQVSEQFHRAERVETGFHFTNNLEYFEDEGLPPVEKIDGISELKIFSNDQRKSKDIDSGMEDDERSETGLTLKIDKTETDDTRSNASTYYSTAEEDYQDEETQVRSPLTSYYGTPSDSLSKFSLFSSSVSSSSGSTSTSESTSNKALNRSKTQPTLSTPYVRVETDSDSSDQITLDELKRHRNSRRRRQKTLKQSQSEDGTAEEASSLVVSTNGSEPEANCSQFEATVSRFKRRQDPLQVEDVQQVFGFLKDDALNAKDLNNLLDVLTEVQGRDDFQKVLHQMGGFNSMLFMYARVVEICNDDETQSKTVNLVLNQLRNHFRLTDGPAYRHYNLVRFVLQSERSTFGFKTFVNVLSYCLSPSGSKLLDCQLLNTCVLSLWRNLILTRCTPNDTPTGPQTLLECLLVVILDLLGENNPHRDFNLAMLKANKFSETLLAICYQLIVDPAHHELSLTDGAKISSLVKSIMAELMAPPDAYVAVTLVQYGLCPLMPKELPPLPRKEDAHFVFRTVGKLTLLEELQHIKEGEEADEEPDSRRGSIVSSDPESEQYSKTRTVSMEASSTTTLAGTSARTEVPELMGSVVGGNRENVPTISVSAPQTFCQTFQESLLEGLMTIMLNALSILPDGGFDSVLKNVMSPYIFVAYCSHPSLTLKKLSLKLLSAYLTRVGNPIMLDFLKSKGFYLTSMYIQNDPDVAQLAINISSGFGPLSFPLATALIHTPTVVNALYDWVKNDEAGMVPALLSMGLMPSIFNTYRNNGCTLQRPLQGLLHCITRFCSLHPKEDPWKVLFCPALESAYGTSSLVSKVIEDALDCLRRTTKKDLKKSDYNNRVMWLLERGSAAKMTIAFDKWLLSVFTLHIMEMDDGDETDYWVHFVKKNRKRLHYLMGVFLCKVFSTSSSCMDLKHYTARILVTCCPNVSKWLPKVAKNDEKTERCLTAFIRIFLTSAEQNKPFKLDSPLRSPSFHALISDNSVLGLPTEQSDRRSSESREINGNTTESLTLEEDNVEIAERAIRTRFEAVLVATGVLSPTNSFSKFSADFKTFKLLVDTHASGVSPIEFRQCVSIAEKLRAPFLLTMGNNKATPPAPATEKPKTVGPPGKNCSANAAYFDEIFEAVHGYAMEMIINVTRNKTQQEIQLAKKISVQDEDVAAVKQWCNIREQLVHPKAPWHFPECYPSFTALDQSEGPCRMRVRLKREFLKINSRFVLPKYRNGAGPPRQPLDYLFGSHAQLLKQPVILNEINFMRFCHRIMPGEELPGEIILTADSMTFIAENATLQSENVEVLRKSITFLMKRRYTLEDRAVEIFLECRSFLFVFKTTKDRDEFVAQLYHKSNGTVSNGHTPSISSSLMETNLTNMTSQWIKGYISNFEYLMYLNTAAGRTYCDLMQYPVFPFILSKYDTPTLDLLAPQSYRDLKKPMAIQDPAKEEHFVSTYNYLKRESDSAPFHYGSHYSNSGIVLHFLVRLPPYTQHFLTYQDGSFDIPDRSFHSVETTWRLASRESNTDFKEAIPEFFYLPEFMQNLQHFDLGVRQNGQRVDDVVLPPWAKGSARLFTLVNRQALESNHVRKLLSNWIDLIFGCKQTGKAAVQALNVFHPSTYEGFEIESEGDELLIKARKAMVSTYGQTPKQLFANYPHPRGQTLSEERCEVEVLDTVWGVRWGRFIGSPACPDLEVINTREFSEDMKLFETPSRVVFWPEETLILGDNVVGKWNSWSISIKAKTVYNTIDDDITACVGTTNSIWVGHQSGRISVLKLSPKLDHVVDKTELIGHYKPIRFINVNPEFSMAISCSGEKYAIVWDINKYPKIAFNNCIKSPHAVDFAYSSRSTGEVALLNRENSVVTLATINGAIVGTIQPDYTETVHSVCLSSLDPGRNVNVIAVGCNNGNIRFYSTWDLKFLHQLKVVQLSSLSVMSIRYSIDGKRLYCMSQTEEGAVTVALQLPTSRKLLF